MSEDKSSNQFPIPGIAFIMLVLGMFIYSDNPFNPTRPSNADQPPLETEKVIARLWQDPFEAIQLHIPKNKDDQHKSHTFENLTRSIQTKLEETPGEIDFQVLAVMVSGAPYAEDKENRIRSRYAVTTALLDAGYIPESSHNINYLNYTMPAEPDDPENISRVLTIPYEWFNEESSDQKIKNISKNILIMWVDEGAISSSHPLDILDDIQNKITSETCYLNSEFDVIGPVSSTTLVKMYLNDDKTQHPYDYRIFSPRATLDDEAILKKLKAKNRDLSGLPNLTRTISTDDKLVDSLLCEMLKRGINPFRDKDKIPDKYNNKKEKNICGEYSSTRLNKHEGIKDYIVLVGEGDTTYSRNFKDLFVNKTEQNKNKNEKWIFDFNYLRGLDGEIANKAKSDTKKVSSTDKKSEKEYRRPVGANQFDYLRRLSSQISALENDGKEGRVRAIGIVGSDTYDILLILQALRDKFPSVLFFTTDLDARLLQNDENKWARNLVVASAFGLYPTNNQSEIPFKGLSFRDSYQTALYNTILQAVTKDQLTINMKVKIFEVGNNGAVDYSSEAKNNLHTVLSSHKKEFLLAILSLILVTALTLPANHLSQLYIVSFYVLILMVVSWVGLYLFFSTDYKEFNYIFSGTSVWLTYIIRMIAFILAMFFIAYAMISLKRSTISIINKNDLSGDEFVNARSRIAKKSNVTIQDYFSVLPETVKSFLNYKYFNRENIKSRKLTKAESPANFIVSSWGWKDAQDKIINLDNLFFQYIDLCKPLNQAIRVLPVSGLYVLFSYYFLESFHSIPIPPYSGSMSEFNIFIIMNAVYVPYIILIFFVSDVTRVNSRFVELLSKYSINWPKEKLKVCCEKYGLRDDIATEKLKLDLIIEYSKVVDRLIFLPFIILTLLIVSKSSYFDRWYTPPELAFVVLIGAVIALSSAIRLRKSAHRAREFTLDKLKDIYRKQKYIEVKHKYAGNKVFGVSQTNMSDRLNDLISEIEAISSGPFLPIAKHPIISSIAMPFGGVGGLYLIEYLTSAGI